MNIQDSIIFFMEILGTIAFAASGAMVGIRKRMDIFGICVLGVVTAVGGGMTRDVILGNYLRHWRNRYMSVSRWLQHWLFLYCFISNRIF